MDYATAVMILGSDLDTVFVKARDNDLTAEDVIKELETAIEDLKRDGL